MMLLAFLNVLSWIAFVTHPLSMKYLVAYSISLFNLTLLAYWWTSPSKPWERRRTTRKSLVVMALLNVILLIAPVLIFVGILESYPI